MKWLLRRFTILMVAVMIGVSNAMSAEDDSASSNWHQTEQKKDLDDPE